MEFRKIKNKEGEILKTKEGKELLELRFEIGDEFIPEHNRVLEKTKETTAGKITNYTLKCKARDKQGNTILKDEKEELFVTLTPAQAKSLQKKTEEGIELNQHLFIAYEYETENYGKQIGIGIKKTQKPPKTFQQIKEENSPPKEKN